MLDPSPPALSELSDKTLHFLSFFAVSLATVTFCRSLRELTLAGAFCGLAGIALELAQSLVPARTFEPGDIMANLAGTGLGIALAAALLLLLGRRWRYA